MHPEQTYEQQSAAEEMDKEHCERVKMDPSSLVLALVQINIDSPDGLIYTFLAVRDRRDDLAARSSSDGRCDFSSDSRLMPPGPQAKINTTCIVTGVQ